MHLRFQSKIELALESKAAVWWVERSEDFKVDVWGGVEWGEENNRGRLVMSIWALHGFQSWKWGAILCLLQKPL